MSPRVGVLLMAYGTPASREDVAAYYTDIRRGRPPSDEQLAKLVSRYDAIGGTFPLRAATEAQRDALRDALEVLSPGGFVVGLGTKHAQPSIEDGVGELLAAGVGAVVGLVSAPHFSQASVGQYGARLQAAAGDVPASTVESWHLLPAYVSFLAHAVEASLAGLAAGTREAAEVFFSAHSLPLRALADDPYPEQLRGTATAVAAQLDLPAARWEVAWQSAGRTQDEWIGPDVVEVVACRAEAGVPAMVVCPCGFTADHLEVAYDLDIVAADAARTAGIGFARTATVGADPLVWQALAGLVHTHATELLGQHPGAAAP